MQQSRKTSRREFVKTAGLGAACLALAPRGISAGEEREKSLKKNVLFIVVDDLRPELGCYGAEDVISPCIDSLASESVVFQRCHCQVPVCGASRASVLTGLRPTRDRFINFKTQADVDAPGNLSLPKHFKNNGYYTVSNGKVYHHRNDGSDGWSEPPWRPKGQWNERGYLSESNKQIALENKFKCAEPFEETDVEDTAYQDGVIAEKSIEDLKRLKEMGQPFFLAVGFAKPHLPFNAPSKYWSMYDPENLNLADNPYRSKDAPDEAFHQFGELRHYHGVPQKGPLSDELARKLVHGYHACVSYMDAQVGKVLDTLEQLGLSDDTIVMLWGDHGWQLGEHGMWCKHCNFKTSLHAPLMIKAPGITGGKQTKALTEFVDIYPTLCELAQLPLPEHLQGDSAVPLLIDPDKQWKEAIFSRFEKGDSIKTDRYCYTEWADKDGNLISRMLYDHEADPDENVNLSEKPENEPLVKELSRMLQEGKKKAL